MSIYFWFFAKTYRLHFLAKEICMAEILVQIPTEYVQQQDAILATLSRQLSAHTFRYEETPPTIHDAIQLTSYNNLDIGLAALTSVASNIHMLLSNSPTIVFESNTSNVSYP